MSSSQLDDFYERQRIDAIAEATGLSADEVEQWVVNDYPEQNSDDQVCGHIVELDDNAPADLLNRLGGTSINIGPLDIDDETEEEPEED